MHPDHDVFIAALEGSERVTLTFASKDDGGAELVRSCAPMDFGPSRRTKDQSDRYHFWDFDSDSLGGPHVLSLLPEQVVSIEAGEESFEPGEFVTWKEIDWIYPRDWGQFG